MELPGKRKRGRPQKRSINIVKEDTQRVGVPGEDRNGGQMVCCSGT